MANNVFQVKRTNTAGRTPNTTASYATNSQYIAAGEFALNMADGILYTSNGSSAITVGSNLVNLKVSNVINVGNSTTTTATQITLGNTAGTLVINNNVLSTNATELALTQTGDAFGSTTLRLRNRTGQNGAVFEQGNASIAIVDFVFAANASTVRNIRFEGRSSQQFLSAPEFQIGEFPAVGGANATLVISDVGALFRRGNVNFGSTNLTINSAAITFVGNSTTSPTISIPNTGVILIGNSSVTAAPQIIIGNTVAITTINTNSVSTKDIFVSSSLSVGNTSENTSVNSTAITVKAISANGSNGSAGQVLTSNGTATYWSTASAGVNTSAQYTWTNTHSFTNTVTLTTVEMGNSIANTVILYNSYALNYNNGTVDTFVNAENDGAAPFIQTVYDDATITATHKASATGLAYSTVSTLTKDGLTSIVPGGPHSMVNVASSNTYSVITISHQDPYTNSTATPSRTESSILSEITLQASNSGALFYFSHQPDLGDGGSLTEISMGSNSTTTYIDLAPKYTGSRIDRLTINGTAIFIGNSTVNTTVNSTFFTGTSNNASYLGTVAAASYVQNTDSRTLSGNLNFTGTNVQFGTHYLSNDSQLRFRTANTSAFAAFVQQSDDNFVFYTTNTSYGTRAVYSIYANTNDSEFSFQTPVRFNSNVTVLVANGTTGSPGQLLASNGSSVYWVSPGAASVNTAAQFTWSNIHTFSANVSFTGNGIGLATNTGAIYLGGIADANWKIGRNTGVTTKWRYTNNSIDIITANSNLEGMVIGLVNGNSYFETGYLGTYIASNVTIGNSSSNSTINSTAFTGTANNTSFVGSVSAANVVSNAQLSANLSNYQTTAGLSANVATLTSNNTSFVGSVSAANVVSNAQLSANLTNYQTTAGLSANVATLTSNNTSFVGTVSAANVVSNAQLQSNLSNYQTSAGLAANVATLAANSATYLNGQLASYYTNATNITTGTLPWAQAPSGTVNTSADFTFSGVHTHNANIVLGSSGVSANGGFGTAGQILTSNGTATYWSTAAAAVNLNSTYTWTNVHTFQAQTNFANISVNGILANGSIGSNNQVLKSNGSVSYWTNNSFETLSNVPSSFTGNAGSFVVVNGGETGLTYSSNVVLDSIAFTAQVAPATPAGDSLEMYVTSTGSSPNKEVALKVKNELGQEIIISSILV